MNVGPLCLGDPFRNASLDTGRHMQSRKLLCIMFKRDIGRRSPVFTGKTPFHVGDGGPGVC